MRYWDCHALLECDKLALQNTSERCCRTADGYFCFPLFSIVGAMKCATGVLRKWLNFHPQLISGVGTKQSNGRLVKTREVHFFSQRILNCTSCSRQCSLQLRYDYLSHFRSKKVSSNRYQKNNLLKYTFDKSPDYMRSYYILKSLKCVVPDVKVIIILRNPAERAISEFFHHCRHHRYQLKADIIHFKPPGSALVNSSAESDRKVLFPCSSTDFHTYVVQSFTRKRIYGTALSDNIDTYHNSSIKFLKNQPAAEELENYLPKEISNGFFDQQIANAFEMWAEIRNIYCK